MVYAVHVSSRFPTTRWTLLRDIRDESRRARAIEHLASTYWEPLYHFARRHGLSESAAEDAIQQFVVVMMERDFVSHVHSESGHLRGFLKTSFRNFLINRFERRSALKRGGGHVHVTFGDAQHQGETSLGSAPQDPEDAYDLAWALSVMNQAYDRLASELAAKTEDAVNDRRVELFERYFSGERLPGYDQLAPEYGMRAAALKAFLHRTRARFRAHLRSVVEDTGVDSPDAELARLEEVLRG